MPREPARGSVCHVDETGFDQDLVNPLRAGRLPSDVARQVDDFSSGQPRIESGGVREYGQFRAVDSQGDRAARSFPKAGDDGQKGGLACTVGPHQPVDRSVGNVQVDGVESLGLTVLLGESFGMDH